MALGQVRADFEALAAVEPGKEFSVTSEDAAENTWVVTFSADNAPSSCYLYDRTTRRAEFLFITQPALSQYRLATMEPVVIPARDGVEMVRRGVPRLVAHPARPSHVYLMNVSHVNAQRGGGGASRHPPPLKFRPHPSSSDLSDRRPPSLPRSSRAARVLGWTCGRLPPGGGAPSTGGVSHPPTL